MSIIIESNETSNIHRAEINDVELRAMAPSVFAQAAMPGTSPRYTFLPTDRIVSAMRAEGWKPTEAREMRPRAEARRGFQRHMIRFQRRDEIAEKGEYTPEVVLINSHDRSSGYQIHAGLFRFICSNGLMVADSLIPSIHVRHTGQEIGQIITASFEILGQLPKLADRVARMRSIGLSADIRRQFAERALSLPAPGSSPRRGFGTHALGSHEQGAGEPAPGWNAGHLPCEPRGQAVQAHASHPWLGRQRRDQPRDLGFGRELHPQLNQWAGLITPPPSFFRLGLAPPQARARGLHPLDSLPATLVSTLRALSDRLKGNCVDAGIKTRGFQARAVDLFTRSSLARPVPQSIDAR